MNKNLQNLKEMALSLDRVKDPFEPSFKKSLKNQKKVLVYHGTTTVKFWELLKDKIFKPKRKNSSGKAYDNSSGGFFVAFDRFRAGVYTSNAIEKFGGERIILALEVPLSILNRDKDDNDVMQAVIRKEFPLKYVTGVHYPATSNHEIPIKKFINMIENGKYDELKTDYDKIMKAKQVRFNQATREDIIHIVQSYLENMIQFTDFDWQYCTTNEFRQLIFKNLSKLDSSKYLYWNGYKWVEFLEKYIYKRKALEVYFNTDSAREFLVPFYKVMKNYESEGIEGYKLFRKSIGVRN